MISLGMVRDVWAFRDFIWSAVKREFRSRWTGTQLGPFWIVAQPLATIVIFTVIFSRILRPGLPSHDSPFAYSIYLCAGVITWQLFAELLSRCVGIFVEHGGLLKKISFPKLCLPIIVVLSSLVNFAIIMALYLVFLAVIGALPGWELIAFLPVLAGQLAFTIGLGMLLASINVFYRDVQQTVQVVLQFWFWLTPIVYVPVNLPDAARTVLELNPMWSFIRAYQDIFLEHAWPHWSSLIYPGLLALFFLWLGAFAFARLQGEIVDEL